MRILYFTNGMASSLNASLEFSRRLVATGHAVTYASHAEIEKTVRAHGHDFERLDEPPKAAKPPLHPKRFIAAFREHRRRRRASIEDLAPVRLLDRLRPDRIVADLEMHTAILKIAGPAAARGIPLLLAMVFFSVHRAPGRPPLHTRLEPAKAPFGRLRIRLLWLRLRLETLHFEWRRRLGRLRRLDLFPPVGYDCFSIDDLRRLARAHGFSLRDETSRRQWLRPFMYTRLPVLSFNSRQLDWPFEPPPNVHYVGTMVMTQDRDGAGRDGATKADSRARLEAFLQADDEAGPLVYASLGSFWSADLELLRAIAHVFERRREWRLVLGLGGKLAPAALGPLPTNVLALAWAPQVEVLRRADAALVHGGVATLNECARLGVPMLVYSTGFVEQDGNAARIGHHGLGLVVEEPAEIEGALGRLLGDASFRERARAVREELAREEERGEAVRLVEEASVASSTPSRFPETTQVEPL